jgi:Predicted thioesterase
VISGVCITTDVDTLLYHMNNARYLRELDFARVDFYERTGLYKKIRQKGGAVVQGACTIRYRRFVRPFSVFKITSKVNENCEQISHLLHCKRLTENAFKNYTINVALKWWSALLHIKTVTIETKKINPLTSLTNLLTPERTCAANCLRFITKSNCRIVDITFLNHCFSLIRANEALIFAIRVVPSG